MEKKIDLIGQMILSSIPIIATPLYAFYRIKKFKKGVLVILANVAIDLVFLTITGDLNWNLKSDIIYSPTFTVSKAYVLIVDILFPLYFARQWTIEYNEKNGTQVGQ